MDSNERSNWRRWLPAVVGAGLLVQFALLVASTDIAAISFWCTASKVEGYGWFYLVHLAFAALAILGILSLAYRRLQPLFLTGLVFALMGLGLQYQAFENGMLYCDVP